MRHALRTAVVFIACVSGMVGTASAQDVKRLAPMSLDSLMGMNVSAASRYEQNTRDAPAAMTVVTAEDIAKYGIHTLDEALAMVRGFYSSYDRNYTSIGTRGFGRPSDYNNRVLLLIDGNPVNEPVFGGITGGNGLGFDLNLVERIEVARGPGSAVYGSNAMFAVVNVVTKRGADLRGIQAESRLGTDARRQLSMLGGTAVAGVDLMMSVDLGSAEGRDLYYAEFDAPETNNGIAHDRDWEWWQGEFVRAEYKGWSATGRRVIRKKGIPTGAWGAEFNGNSSTTDRGHALDLRGHQAIGPGKQLVLSASYNEYRYSGLYANSVDGGYPVSAGGRWLLTGGLFMWDVSPAARLTLGVERKDAFHVDHVAGANQEIGGDYPYAITSGSGQLEYGFTSKLTAHVGLRFDDHSEAGSFFSPRAALVYRPDEGTSLKLIGGKAYRAPNVYEVNFRDIFHMGDAGMPIGAETIETFELLGERRLSASILATASVYSNNVRNLIDLVDANDVALVRYTNRDQARARGLELEVGYHSGSELVVDASYNFQKTYDTNTGLRLTNSPRHLLKLAGAFGVQDLGTLGTQVRYESARETPRGTRTEAFVLMNSTLTSRALFGGLSASLELRNVMNTAYSTSAGSEHRQSSIQQDGRSWSIGLRYLFQ